MLKKLVLLAVALLLAAGCDPEMGMAKIHQDLPDAGDDGGIDTDSDDGGIDTDSDDGGVDTDPDDAGMDASTK